MNPPPGASPSDVGRTLFGFPFGRPLFFLVCPLLDPSLFESASGPPCQIAPPILEFLERPQRPFCADTVREVAGQSACMCLPWILTRAAGEAESVVEPLVLDCKHPEAEQ